MKPNEVIEKIQSGSYDAAFGKLYVDSELIFRQRDRYIHAVQQFVKLFGEKNIEIYSAPGRSEISGNHTDHQRGKVLAASVNMDVIAVVSPREDDIVNLKSEGYPQLQIDLKTLKPIEEEKESTSSLIRGVATGMQQRGLKIRGFYAYADSDVLSGSGLSSSAAFETLIGNIFSGLYNGGSVSAVSIAEIGQEAENIYFGKPSGLMDQMASSVGGLTYIDFKDPKDPKVVQIQTDFSAFGCSLCIVDTKGSHANLTGDYAAVPIEMKKVAAYFGKDVLRQVDEDNFYKNLPVIRKELGDRAVMRAIHFYDENHRVEMEKEALENKDFESFKKLILASGDSSYRFLQNVYPLHDPQSQGLAFALLMTEKFLGEKGAWRVHGGGFAGTIQAFVPDDMVEEYRKKIEPFFGEGSCHVLKIRQIGGTRVI